MPLLTGTVRNEAAAFVALPSSIPVLGGAAVRGSLRAAGEPARGFRRRGIVEPAVLARGRVRDDLGQVPALGEDLDQVLALGEPAAAPFGAAPRLNALRHARVPDDGLGHRVAHAARRRGIWGPGGVGL